MNKILRIINKEFGNLGQAALMLGLFNLLSQVLGLFRDRSIAHFIGPSPALDAYYAAFRIPDFIFVSISSLVSITVIVPFILEKMKVGENESEVNKEASDFISQIFTVFLVAIVAISVIIFILLPYIVNLTAGGFNADMQYQVVILSRIMLLSPILLGLSNLFGTITQLFHRFFVYSLSPIFYNFGIIAGVIFFYPIWGIKGLAFGVVLGAILHFLIQAIASAMLGFKPKLTSKIDYSNIKKVLNTSLPRTLGLSANSMALIVIVSFASFLTAGSISVFTFATNLQAIPQGLIGLSYAVAAFPLLARAYASENKSEFKKHLRISARAIIFWTLPITFLFIVLRAQIVRVILGSGSFSWDSTRLVAASLALFSISIFAQSMISLLSRAYYATGETKKPLIINVACSMLIILLAYVLIHVFNDYPLFRYFIESMFKVSNIPGTAILMLPLAYSLGTILNFVLHWVAVRKDFMEGETFIFKSFFQSLGASFFIGATAYGTLYIIEPFFGTTTFWGVLFQGLISGFVGLVVGGIVLYLLKNEEIKEFVETLKSKFWKALRILPSQEEL
ncbi:MAG: murein biosynthesis integral membrane protein MurJ [Candidatus Nomurabacteria bacterium]|nr:murein biosynthesis integral membrane protein MurJ [Candidatus Nomurabacteria bacterium]